jgi:hypothetical protein
MGRKRSGVGFNRSECQWIVRALNSESEDPCSGVPDRRTPRKTESELKAVRFSTKPPRRDPIVSQGHHRHLLQEISSQVAGCVDEPGATDGFYSKIGRDLARAPSKCRYSTHVHDFEICSSLRLQRRGDHKAGLPCLEPNEDGDCTVIEFACANPERLVCRLECDLREPWA